MPFTILDEIVNETEVLHSRFVCSLRHASEEADFIKHLKDIKDLYPKAAHYCYGARIGNNEKMGDDGEPSHSAGLQILSSLRYRNIDDVSIIIVRYFGGTKLGLPRLTRTYRELSEETIEKATLMENKPGLEAKLSIPYSDLDHIRYRIDKLGFKISSIAYDDRVTISVLGEEKAMQEFLKDCPEGNIVELKKATLYSEVKI